MLAHVSTLASRSGNRIANVQIQNQSHNEWSAETDDHIDHGEDIVGELGVQRDTTVISRGPLGTGS